MFNEEEILIKDPEVVEHSKEVTLSSYRDVLMFVFRANGAEPICNV